MKSAVIALLLAACGQATAVTTSRALATQWLSSHAAPSDDQLAELKGVNPDAYALVKALLMKRSLGLLDPKHPTASFAAAPPKEEDVPRGPEAFQQFQTPAKDAVYADVPAAPSAHHGDWLNWKPQSSAMDDDAMVKSVLGAVANLKAGQQGGSLRGAQHQQQNDGLTWTQPAPAAELKAEPVAQAEPIAEAQPVEAAPKSWWGAPKAAPKAAMSQENSYLKDVDFGIKIPAVAAVAAPVLGDNSYLKGLNLDNSAAPVAAVATPHQQEGAAPDSALSSFSFDDSAAATTAAPKATVAPKAQPGNALLAWLGGSVAKKAAPKVAQIQTPKRNAMDSYLADLQ